MSYSELPFTRGNPVSHTFVIEHSSRFILKKDKFQILSLAMYYSYLVLSLLFSLATPLPSSPKQCGGAVPLPTFLFLDKFCEDCYNLYKIEEIFSECRADCFRNDFFYFCLNVTLVDDDTQQKAGKYLITFFTQ